MGESEKLMHGELMFYVNGTKVRRAVFVFVIYFFIVAFCLVSAADTVMQ